jgi:aspartate/methionine/tyrosine aminotransferase
MAGETDSMRAQAARMDGIAPFHVCEVLDRAAALEAAGRDVIHMEIGEPDFPTAEPIRAAATAFLAGGSVRYTSALGLPALRRAIAERYAREDGVEVDPNRVIVTAGASAALFMALASRLDAGDGLLLADPGYPCNRNYAHLLGIEEQAIPVDATTGYQPTAESIADAWRPSTRAVLLASPANPTGTVVPDAEVRRIHEIVAERGGVLIVDEIYRGLVYGPRPATAASLGGDVLVVNSFSKYEGMTGWRLGWLVAPPESVRALEVLSQNLYIAASTVAQHAALAAFEPGTEAIFEERRDAFRRRRDLLVPGLIDLGFVIPVVPEGAFYVYAGIDGLADDGERLCLELLEQVGVAVTPGIDFGRNCAERYVRFAYTTGEDRIAEALGRMVEHLAGRGGSAE